MGACMAAVAKSASRARVYLQHAVFDARGHHLPEASDFTQDGDFECAAADASSVAARV